MAAERPMQAEDPGKIAFVGDFVPPVVPSRFEESDFGGAAMSIINGISLREPQSIGRSLASLEKLVKVRISDKESGMRVKTIMATAMFISAKLRTPEADPIEEKIIQRFIKDRDEAWVGQIERKWPSRKVRLMVSDPLIETHYVNALERTVMPKPQIKKGIRLN